MMLEDQHSTDDKEMPDDIKWSRYFKWPKLEKLGLVEPEDPSLQTRQAPGHINLADVEYVDYKKGKVDSDAETVARVFSGEDMYKCNSGRWRLTSVLFPALSDPFEPSDFVLHLRDEVLQQLGDKPKLMLHLRRGDVLKTGYPGKATAKRFQEVTDIDFMKKHLFDRYPGTQLVVFTNERDPEYLTALKRAHPDVVLETEFEALKRVTEEIDDGYVDGFLAYEVANQVFRKGEYRWGTHAEHFGPTHGLLIYV
jgi:hypothetical protein